MQSGYLKYDISFQVNTNHPFFKSHSIELHEKLIRANTPSQKIVYFDQVLSAIHEVNNEYGHEGEARIVYSRNQDEYLYYKKFPFIEAHTRMKILEPNNSEFIAPHIEIFNEYKTILKYRCQKAVVKENDGEKVVWFTCELDPLNEVKGVLAYEGIPGLIMEEEESLNEKKLFALKTEVSEISTQPAKQSALKVPVESVEFENMAAALKKNKALLQDSYGKPLEDNTKLAAFSGKWEYHSGNQQLSLNILIEESEKLTIEHFNGDGKLVNSGAYFPDRKSLIMYVDYENYRKFQFKEDQKLLVDDKYPFITYSKLEER